MTGFEPGPSGIKSDHAVSCATAAVQCQIVAFDFVTKFKAKCLQHWSQLAETYKPMPAVEAEMKSQQKTEIVSHLYGRRNKDKF